MLRCLPFVSCLWYVLAVSWGGAWGGGHTDIICMVIVCLNLHYLSSICNYDYIYIFYCYELCLSTGAHSSHLYNSKTYLYVYHNYIMVRELQPNGLYVLPWENTIINNASNDICNICIIEWCIPWINDLKNDLMFSLKYSN